MKRRIKRGLNYITDNIVATIVYGDSCMPVYSADISETDINTIKAYRFIHNHVKVKNHVINLDSLSEDGYHAI